MLWFSIKSRTVLADISSKKTILNIQYQTPMNPRHLYSAGLKLLFIALIFLIQLAYIFFSSQKLNVQRTHAQQAVNELVIQIDTDIKTSINKAPQQLLRGNQVGLETDGITKKTKNMEEVLAFAAAQFRDLMIIIGVTVLIQIFLLGSAGFSLMRAAKK